MMSLYLWMYYRDIIEYKDILHIEIFNYLLKSL